MCDEMRRLQHRNAQLEAKAAAEPIDNGGPAFAAGYHPEGNSADHPGMSLRDYFAAAEQIADDDAGNWELLESLAGNRPDGNWSTNPLGWLAWDCKWRAAIKLARADAMLTARKEVA
jgi:hypothetical protein